MEVLPLDKKCSQRIFSNYEKVPTLLDDLCKVINEDIEKATKTLGKIQLSYKAHFNLVSIHPYYDGNGRTGRLLMNLLQCRFGLPMGIVHSEDKLEYFSALEESRNSESLDPFSEFMDGQYMKQLATEIGRYKSQV